MRNTVAAAATDRRPLVSLMAAMLALALFATVARADDQPAPYVPPGSGPTVEDGYLEVIEKVAAGVWVIRQAQPFHLQPIGNVTVIEQSDGLVLVDGGGSPGSARRIAALVKGVSRKPVKALILTHWHGDHSLGFGTLKTIWPKMKVYASAVTAQRLKTSMDFYAHGAPDAARTAEFMKRLDGADQFLRAAAVDPKLTDAQRQAYARAARAFVRYRQDTDGLFVGAVDDTFDGPFMLPDRIRPVRAFLPGRANTDGDAVVTVPTSRVLIAGDLVVAPIPFGFNAYPKEWLAALDALDGEVFDVLVPGHGTPQADRVYLQRVRDLIEATRARTAALVAAGATLEEAKAKVDLSDHAKDFVGDDPFLRQWFDQYWTTPFVEVCWKEAKGLPIEQGKG